MKTLFLLFILTFMGYTKSQEAVWKFCAPDVITDSTCNAISSGESDVRCVRVTDNTECALKMQNGDADFGVFTAEELLLAYQYYPNEIQPIVELRHIDLGNSEFQFQSVAVVPSNYNPVANSFEDLRDGGFCHPGFSRSQIWNDNILKHFERKVYQSTCRDELTVAENEVENLKLFFGKACRPGEWVSDRNLNDKLKNNHKELCSICDDTSTCTYRNTDNEGHIGALDCLTSGRGKVAYVALHYVEKYFADKTTQHDSNKYQFLCPDGSVQSLTSKNPCAWVRQPWKVIAAKTNRASDFRKSLTQWLSDGEVRPSSNFDWVVTLKKNILNEATVHDIPGNITLEKYLSKGREINFNEKSTCGKPIRWCTINSLETLKCNLVAKEAIALGIEPTITCTQAESTFQCFRYIAEDKADIIVIDSHYGYLARQIYNLSTVLYTETEKAKLSTVVAIVREKEPHTIQTFEDLRKRTACFPEYGGIAWISFINAARSNGIISDSCEYSEIVADLFSGACTPGILDTDHSNVSSMTLSKTSSNAATVLCSLCSEEQNRTFCSANRNNHFYGDKGALNCLKNGGGDVAFIEVKNLHDYTRNFIIQEKDFRVLCKNGTLAVRPGFTVDEPCALSVTIDSEVVGRRTMSDIDRTNIVLALLKLEDWLGYRPFELRPISIYDKFNGVPDLLFKDSTIRLENVDSTIKSVIEYKELFSHVDACSSAPFNTILSFGILVIISLISRFI